MAHAAQITDPAKIRRFTTAGRALFTLVSEKTGQRFTYRVQVKKDDAGAPTDFFFVSVLTSPNNTGNYTYLGCLRSGRFIDDRKLRIGADAPSRVAFVWFWARVSMGRHLLSCQCWHEGSCGRCGRTLTTPKSVSRGLGPVCAGMAA